jgi:sugar lactone lactonase YvrE
MGLHHRSAERSAKWVVLFVALFCAASLAALLAGSQSASAEGEENAPEVQLPTSEDMSAALHQFETEEEEEREYLESPGAVSEREASKTQYAGLAISQAEQLFRAQFGEQLQLLDSEPARFLSDAKLDKPLGPTTALVTDEGQKLLLEGTGPVQAMDSEGDMAKVDLTLEKTEDGYEPVNPVVDVSIPESADEGVDVGDQGVQITPAGAEESAAQPFGEMDVFYPEVEKDTDLLVAPIGSGVELFDQLRSEESPETLYFHVQLPAGASLQAEGNAAEVVSSDDSRLTEIAPPTAVDAQGQQVPVEMQVEGNLLVLEVGHRQGDFAYPILVDPEVKEEWYWENWYNGQKLEALSSPGPWQWNTSDGKSSSYVYGSTFCIYKCWGSGHGLYISTPNGNLPANKWGQWSYSTRNSDTRIIQSWISPFWREEHTNCPASKYAQPYDYDGLWNTSGGWSALQFNETRKNNNQGWAALENVSGEALIIGMGTSSGISIPCWRDIMAGGVAIWLNDGALDGGVGRPTLTTTSSGTWMDKSSIRLKASAYDAGFGIKKFKAVATNTSGSTEEWWTTNSCTGLYAGPCPNTWNLGETSQPQLSYSPAALPEGIDTLSVTAYDAIEKPSLTTNQMTVRVDHAPPAIALSGTVTEQAKLGTERPSYTIKAVAKDGDPASKENSKARSGVVKLEFEVDGKLVAKPFVPKCAGESNCGAEEELKVPASEMSAGSHTMYVKAEDAYGHVGIEKLTFTTGDKKAPVLAAVNGLPESSPPTYAASSFGDNGTGPGKLSGPTGVATDGEGNIWVLDTGHSRVQKFNPDGEFIGQFGDQGSSDGQFWGAHGIALDPNGNIWVADTTTSRVQEFNSEGEFIRKFGSYGTGNGKFTSLQGVAVDAEGHVWAVDAGKDRVQEFSAEGTYMAQFGTVGSESGQLKDADGIAVDAKGNIWIADTGNNRIQEFNSKGEFIRKFGSEGTGSGQLKSPTSLALDPEGNVWVTDSGNNRVEKFSAEGAYLSQYGTAGNSKGQFSEPQGIALDATGGLLVADTGNNRVQELSAGEFVRRFGGEDSEGGQLSYPSDATFDSEGNLWVLDEGHSRVQEFDSEGNFLREFGAKGTGDGLLLYPSGLAVDSEGNIWVADAGNYRIQEFNSKGEFIRKFGSKGTGNGKFTWLEDVAVDPEGRVWAVDVSSTVSRIEKFNSKGEYLAKFGSSWGSANGQFWNPRSITADSKGNLWVSDSSNYRIQEFNSKFEFVRKFGSGQGSGNGQFKEMKGVAVGPEGNVWVADSQNNRIQEFSGEGVYLGQLGTMGNNDGQLYWPEGVAVDSKGNLWVADTRNDRVQEFAASEFIRKFGGDSSGAGHLSGPEGVAHDSEGNVWVVDASHDRIQEFNASGKFIRQFGSYGSADGLFFGPHGIAVDSKGNVWVADTGNDRLQEFNPKGEFVRKFGSAGKENGQFESVEDVAVDAEGNLWTVDSNLARIQEFTPEGKFIRQFGVKGIGKSELESPEGITIDPEGNVWVANSNDELYSSRIEEFTAKGEFIRSIGSQGAGNGQFKHPTDLSFDSEGNLWVADTTNDRIQEFSSDGTYMGQYGSGGSSGEQLSDPKGVSADSKGNIWVADTGNDRVQAWTLVSALGARLEPVNVTATDDGYGVASVRAELTNSAKETEVLEETTQPCPEGACSLSTEFSDLDLADEAPGIYTLTIKAVDGAGGVSYVSRDFTLDPGPPDISLSGAVAESAGQPFNAPDGELEVEASETALPTSGVTTVNVERDHQRVASYPFDCVGGCQKVEASYRYSAKRDSAERSIEQGAEPSGSTLTALSGVACSSSSDCQAVGYYKNSGGTIVTLAEHWNGEAWQVQSTPNPSGALESRLEGVSCTSASNCIAVGYYKTGTEAFSTLAVRWNGSQWTIASTPNPAGIPRAYLYGVSCGAANDCWAVGKAAYSAAEWKSPTALLERWNGSAWSLVSASELPAQLRAISCSSATSCVAVTGQEGSTVERWDGSNWTPQVAAAPSSAPSGVLASISCVSAEACTAVGTYLNQGHTAPLAENWDGSHWSVLETTDPVGVVEEVNTGRLEGVSCATASSCTAVGTRTTSQETLPLVESWDGAEWGLQPTPSPIEVTTATLAGVSCVGEFDCTFVGSKVDSTTQALIQREAAGEGSQTLTVEAVDRYGDAESESIAVDVPEEITETPTCNEEATSVAPKATISASQAGAALEKTLPTAVASSEATTDEATDEQVDPSYSPPKPNLESIGSLAEGETSVTPEGGFTLKGIACVTPAKTTSAATEAKVFNGDAAVFANTAPETDTVIRPTADGMAFVQNLRGSSAPTSVSWNVSLNPDEKLIKLPSGAIAITQAGSAGEATGETPKLAKPQALETRAVLNDAGLQLEVDTYHLTKAEAETSEEVIAVIAQPWVILKQGSIIPLKMEVEPDAEVPTEYTVTYTLPKFELNVTPESVVGEAASASSVNGGCSKNASPCGDLDLDGMARYGVYWGNPEHHEASNPYYHDYEGTNCTNFISQILKNGGDAKFMRAFEKGDDWRDGSWWYYNFGEGGVFGNGPSAGWDNTASWSVAEILPRHLWQYELAYIDSVQQPRGWTKGNIVAYDWFNDDGKGDINHLNFVVGTRETPDGREPLIANSASKDEGTRYSHKLWSEVKKRIEKANGSAWTRFSLAARHRVANWKAKKRAPDNLYGPNGLFRE